MFEYGKKLCNFKEAKIEIIGWLLNFGQNSYSTF